MSSETLTASDRDRLSDLEQIVIGHERDLIEVAKALREIRDERLYRNTHSSFKAYCDERFGFSRQRGYQLINFAVELEVSTTVGTLTTERAARQARTERKSAQPAAPETPQPQTKDAEFMSACGVGSFGEAAEVVKGTMEPKVTEYYNRLECLVNDALENASDKQLASMSVYAATIAKRIKQVLQERKQQ